MSDAAIEWIESTLYHRRPYLDLSGCQLTFIPDELRKLKSYPTFKKSHQFITLDLFAADTLSTLNLRDNSLSTLPNTLLELPQLQLLNVGRNKLREFPSVLKGLRSLKTLDLSSNELRSIPKDIATLKSLETLNLSGNHLTFIADELEELDGLRNLSLDSCALSGLSNPPKFPRSLETLVLSGNGLTGLPASIRNLDKLRVLYLDVNPLRTFPLGVLGLKSLEILHLEKTELTSLPPLIGQLGAIREMFLDQNELSDLPNELTNLDYLTRLALDGNPLREPLPAVLAQGTEAVLAYLKSLAEAGVRAYEAKLIVLGEGNVGKSSLIAAMQGRGFVKDRLTTHGISLGSVELQHPDPNVQEPLIINTWDFGGQQVYRITHQFFFSKRSLYVIAWWPREGAEAGEVEEWLRRIRLRVPDARVMIVSTHADEPRHPELDYPLLEKKYPGVLAGQFAVDSSSGSGISDLLVAIAREAAGLPQMGEKWNPRWIACRDEVLIQPTAQISRQQFCNIAEDNGLSAAEAGILLALLSMLGRVVHYGDDEGLQDVVVIKPEWLTKAIGYVLEDRETLESAGVLRHDRLAVVWDHHGRADWDRYEAEHYPFFLRLMEKFDVSYRLVGEDASLVAQLLPYQRPSLPWEQESALPADWREISGTCEMDENPPGLMPWFTVRNHRYVWERLLWRRGAFLAYKGQEALVELTVANSVEITARGRAPEHFFALLRDTLATLIGQRWSGLQFSFTVPCRGVRSGARCTGRFNLEDLQGLRADSITDLRCPRCKQVQDVNLLLSGYETVSGSVEQTLDEILARTKIIGAEVIESERGIRSLLRALSAENRDCPRLFTIVPREGTFATERFELVLWCEHPGHEHPCLEATYEISESKEWLRRVAPVLPVVVKGLKLILASAGLGGLSHYIPENFVKVVDSMHDLVELLIPGGQTLTDDRPESNASVTRAQGEALRELSALLMKLDSRRRWGGMRPFLTTSGDYLWICPNHVSEYDPGLPSIPVQVKSLP